MCAQCMTTAAVAAVTAGGLRSWLAAQTFGWLTPARLRWITGLLVVGVILASATLSGTGS